MFLHLGNNVIINTKSIIGIFDIETTSTSQITKDFLNNTNKIKIINVSYDMPKTFILSIENKEIYIYISPISSLTLRKRFKYIL